MIELLKSVAFVRPAFWNVIRHVDRLDSILTTHLGADNLPGINSLLVRKVQEGTIRLPVDASSDEYQVSIDLTCIMHVPAVKFDIPSAKCRYLRCV